LWYAVYWSSHAAAAAAGVLLMRLLPGSLQYREVPAALLRGWMLGKVGPAAGKFLNVLH
jgi:hypothetical protein